MAADVIEPTELMLASMDNDVSELASDEDEITSAASIVELLERTDEMRALNSLEDEKILDAESEELGDLEGLTIVEVLGDIVDWTVGLMELNTNAALEVSIGAEDEGSNAGGLEVLEAITLLSSAEELDASAEEVVETVDAGRDLENRLVIVCVYDVDSSPPGSPEVCPKPTSSDSAMSSHRTGRAFAVMRHGKARVVWRIWISRLRLFPTKPY